ncbi:MAG: pantoate--beta-alanine ligase [Chitinispirillaceae bacterium]|nr:pantoate--beta-alanine ligase [Chitinispirillaceae bacterium]
MKTVTSVHEMTNLAYAFRSVGKRIVLIPTMGALHRGHLSLLKIAKELADVTVMSVFVNPTQFGPHEDYSRYPRPFDEDCRKAEAAGCDVVFAPAAGDMYPPLHSTSVQVDGITTRLCGKSRPTHFQGVTTVVLKLFNCIKPHFAVFGQKDAQQLIIIRRMVEDLYCPVDIVAAPIVRENDGLALSSRNAYLTQEERSAAVLISEGLQAVEKLFSDGERHTAPLIETIEERFAQSSLIAPEYVEIVDLCLLEPVDRIADSALVAVACRMGQSNTRLIDNIILGGRL